jgi:hypothetical protein
VGDRHLKFYEIRDNLILDEARKTMPDGER